MKLSEIALLVNGNLIGDGEIEVFKINSLSKADKGEISFVEKSEKFDSSKTITASCLLIPDSFEGEFPYAVVRVSNPKLAFAKIAAELHPELERSGWHKSFETPKGGNIGARFIGKNVTIGRATEIGEHSELHDGVRIGNDVRIGDSTKIYPNCVIYDGVSIGDNCVIHAGAIIGADGFGFVRGEDGYTKFPQIGSVEIANDVEIGANSCIDRGSLGVTKIGQGTKIDNLVQIAHNVRIGKRVVIASQTGISGSVEIADDCVIAGQVGFGDHARIEKGAVIGAKSAVFPGKIVRSGVWAGIPVKPLQEYKRTNAHINSLSQLKERIEKLEELVNRKDEK